MYNVAYFIVSVNKMVNKMEHALILLLVVIFYYKRNNPSIYRVFTRYTIQYMVNVLTSINKPEIPV